MRTNSDLTVYHKVFDETERLEKWKKYYYKKVWYFGGKGSSVNRGYENANDVNVRIPYDLNKNLNIENFSIGDIIVKGKHSDITKQQDLIDYDIYNITSINDNNFGSGKHIHLGGK